MEEINLNLFYKASINKTRDSTKQKTADQYSSCTQAQKFLTNTSKENKAIYKNNYTT